MNWTGGTRFGSSKRPGTGSARLVGGSGSSTHSRKDIARSNLWDRRLRMRRPKEECRLLKGRFGCAFEKREGAPIPSNHNIPAWLRAAPWEAVEIDWVGVRWVNFRRNTVGARMAKLGCLWSDGVFLGYRSVTGETVVGNESGVFKTRTFQRCAYEHPWHRQNIDMVGGLPWRTSTSVDSEEGIMPAVDIGMDMREVHIPRAQKEDEFLVP